MKKHFFFISKSILIQLVAISTIFLIVAFFYKTADSNSLEELSSELLTDTAAQSAQTAQTVEPLQSVQPTEPQVEPQSEPVKQVELVKQAESVANLDEDKMQALILQMETVVKQMSGEGMVMLVEDDMLDILAKNETLAKENERLVAELAKAKDLLAKQAQREQEILAIADKLTQLNNASKVEEQEIKEVPTPSKATVSADGAIEGVSTDGTKLPFNIVSLAEDYIVVEKLGGGYDSVEVGESVRGQILLNIDMIKKVLTTDKGEFELRKLEEKPIDKSIEKPKLEEKPVKIPKLDQPLVPKLDQKVPTKVTKPKEKLKSFPYKVLGMGSGFIVVEQGDDFRTVKEGESLEFIDKNVKAKLTVLKVNTSKSSIETDLGTFTFNFKKA